MTRSFPDRREFGFAAQAARADLTSFTRWHDRRGLIARPGMAECEASLSRPEDESIPAAPMREVA